MTESPTSNDGVAPLYVIMREALSLPELVSEHATLRRYYDALATTPNRSSIDPFLDAYTQLVRPFVTLCAAREHEEATGQHSYYWGAKESPIIQASCERDGRLALDIQGFDGVIVIPRAEGGSDILECDASGAITLEHHSHKGRSLITRLHLNQAPVPLSSSTETTLLGETRDISAMTPSYLERVHAADKLAYERQEKRSYAANGHALSDAEIDGLAYPSLKERLVHLMLGELSVHDVTHIRRTFPAEYEAIIAEHPEIKEKCDRIMGEESQSDDDAVNQQSPYVPANGVEAEPILTAEAAALEGETVAVDSVEEAPEKDTPSQPSSDLPLDAQLSAEVSGAGAVGAGVEAPEKTQESAPSAAQPVTASSYSVPKVRKVTPMQSGRLRLGMLAPAATLAQSAQQTQRR